ncbi:MAG: AAA family ATPase [Nitrospinota bacterium]|nr:MAG: AAA family ATPase [Nitrospinota bacterium]
MIRPEETDRVTAQHREVTSETGALQTIEQIKRLLGRPQNLLEGIQALLAERDRLRRALIEAKAQIESMREEIKKLSAPPLPYGIYEGPSKLPDHVTIKVDGKKYDVQIANKAINIADLNRGQELLLNGAFNVVDVYGYEERGELSRVLDVLQDDRLIIRFRENEERVVHRAQPLINEKVKVGDYVRFDPKSQLVIEVLPRREVEDVILEKVPETRYSDIGGLSRQIEQIRDAIELPYLHKSLYTLYQLRPPKGVLLYGPPGCGKTLIAKAVARALAHKVREKLEEKREAIELYQMLVSPQGDFPWERFQRLVHRVHPAQDPSTAASEEAPPPVEAERREKAQQWLEAYLDEHGVDLHLLPVELTRIEKLLQSGTTGHFINIKGPELLNKYVGETERKIREIFQRAKEKAQNGLPVVIFFDEMESMFKVRGSGISSDVDSTVVPQLLTEIDGVEGMDNVVIIGASNRQDLLDPAVLRPGRLDIKIKIDRPNREAAREIFAKYLLPSLPLHPTVRQEGESREETVQRMITCLVDEIYSEKPENRCFQLVYADGEIRTLYRKDLISGALIAGIVSRAKKKAIKRYLATGEQGIMFVDLLEAVDEEYRESEDLPNTHDPDDWARMFGEQSQRIRAIHSLFMRQPEEESVEHS